ncbi:MAG: winged helix-turn-helix transcriptional regulator [Clostridia bacterium]|nr:winged helix-turn-helix transcriptional regulator [Clostridia bacterium]
MNGETFFRKKRIAVVSKRRNVSDFLRLEAESCGCSVSVMSRLPPELSEYDIVMVDDDGSYEISEFSDNVYIIASEERFCEGKENTFLWPMPVVLIRRVFEGYVTENTARIYDREESVIWLSDGEKKTVIYKDKRIVLTEGEWKVLLCLGQAHGEPVSREALRELFDASDGNITDVYICHLRRKLEEPFGVKLIRTVRCKGYAISATVKGFDGK